ncbi:rho GTPase-activating protein 30 [Clinocottus analis]|uniref:rho GTPase-activating protein 30 n=1 Tax=Clinocottus analis TaxID=304258 RepID=UPI0035BEEC25
MRRVRRKIGNKEKVFGCDLLEHLTASSQEIPQVLQCCSEFVEKHGVVDGIYRLSGVSSNIQKLRGEFESDGSPDLQKELYMQDIHCVSSLCKAYFRELPNPLLTYQLYDKFAEAVAIQLEEERLVKIRDVLKELPPPHHRTLEFLMRHLVRMASYCSETNMHSRNLAIVWAPNLLRSKDIETSGFNGTAAFMEVRVQSIVVEFILTHVPQLFPEPGGSDERRKSLPSPTPTPNQEEGFVKAAPTHPFPHFGHISPGDGPLAMRSYHAIIEGTDKRKGSLKGRKWMSIFNIGGRFPDPRRRHKHSSKEKDRPALRPARSMDSLSSSPFPHEGPRRAAQCPPDASLSPLAAPSGPEVPPSPGALGGSEYAVTYRRGTGLVSGGAGTQGTYTCLDPEGLGLADNETLQSRSPGLSSKGRRAAMHITGPTMVTVPLHITSNLALGVLQGGGAARVIHRGRDREGGDKVVGKEGGERAWRRESRGVERKVEEGRKVEEEEKIQSGKATDGEGVVGAEGSVLAVGGGGGEEKEGEGKKEQEEGEGAECSWKPEPEAEGRTASGEQRAESRTSNTEEGRDVHDDNDADEYMDMEGVKPVHCQPEATERGDDCVFDASDVLNSTEAEDDHELSGYVQDNFEFLDHMDCSVPHQVHEFSVEPPGHSDDEYEVMEQADPQPGADAQTWSPTELNPHRPPSIDSQNRHTKSLSLPYMTSPVFASEESCSEDEAAVEDSDDDSDSMFTQSLPSSSFFESFPFETDADKRDSRTSDGVPVRQSRSSEGGERRSPNDFGESTAGNREQVEVEDKGEEDGLREKEIAKTEEEDHQSRDQRENNRRSKAQEEDVAEDSQSDEELPPPPEAPAHCCDDFPPPGDDDSNAWAEEDMVEMEEEEEMEEMEEDMLDNHPSDYTPCQEVPCATKKHTGDILDEEFGATDQPKQERGRDDEGEDSEVNEELEDACREMVLEYKESDDNVWEESPEEGNEVVAEEKHEEKMQAGDKEPDGAICRTGGETCVELEEVICEVTEVEESKQAEKMDASVAEEGDAIEDVKVGEEEVPAVKVSGEETLEVEEGAGNEVEVTVEGAEESTESTEDKFTEPERQREPEEKEANLPKTSELEDPSQGKGAANDEGQRPDEEEAVSKEKEEDDDGKERADEQRRAQPSVDERLKEVRCDGKERNEGGKSEGSDRSRGGVGRKLVVTKHPRVYQAKAVPVVPPKPQHCKITALTLRHQQQQRENRDADGGGENTPRVPTEHDAGDSEDEGKGRKGRPTLRGGERAERERERRRDGEDNATRDTSRNSPLSMCFDEAVAKATMRREKEKECEKERERERERDWGNEGQ